jgi:hypothetical protein
LLLGCCVALLAGPSALPSSAQTDDGENDAEALVRVVGQLPILEPGDHKRDGFLILNPVSRRAYELFQPGNGNAVIQSFDLDSLSPLQRRELPDFRLVIAGESNAPGDVVHAVDESRGKIYLGGISGPQFLFQDDVVIGEVDEVKFNLGQADFLRLLRVPDEQKPQLQERLLYGIEFFEQEETAKLLLLFSSPPQGVNKQVNDHWLVQWDISTGAPDWEPLLLEPCLRAPLVFLQNWAYQIPILRGATSIYLPCQDSNATGLAVRIGLDENGAPIATQQRAFRMPSRFANVVADPASERLLFMMQLNGFTWWVFDGPTNSIVGSIGLSVGGAPVGAGIDRASGRLVSLVADGVVGEGEGTVPIQGGLFLANSRLTPAPQAANALPGFAYPGQFRIAVDPETTERPRRYFIRRGNPTLLTTPTYPDLEPEPKPIENFYTIVEDTLPVPEQPSFFDVDSNTTGQPEEEGITSRTFEASAQSFGVRALFIGGITASLSRELDNTLTEACYRNDREVVIGKIESAHLSDLQVTAASIGLHMDESGKQDLANPGTRCPPPPLFGVPLPPEALSTIDDLAGRPWDEDGVEGDDYTSACVGDGVNAAEPPRPGRQYEARVECRQSEGSVEAYSRGAIALPDEAPIVKVAESWSEASLQLAEDGGVELLVESTARGVEIVGVGTIGLIRATAVSHAAGRPDTAAGTFERTICGVDIPGFQQSWCLTADQQRQFVEALNRVIGRGGEARLREPDSDYLNGSPGGYLAAVQRDRRQALSDETITRDASITVPALELIFYRSDDSSKGAGRQVFQFAGVQGSTVYGVTCLFGQSASGACVQPTSELRALLYAEINGQRLLLKGGKFEVHLDTDADQKIGVNDPVVKIGDGLALCESGEDGIGNCLFSLPPGNYVVRQTSAPPGFSAAPDCAISLPAFTSVTCEFGNQPAIGAFVIGLDDESGNPLPGGSFEVYSDADASQSVGAGDQKIASCSTGSTGLCAFPAMEISEGLYLINCDVEKTPPLCEVADDEGNAVLAPLGKYVIKQSTVPSGYLAAPDHAFELSQPLAVQVIGFTNGLAGTEGTQGTPSTPSTKTSSLQGGGSKVSATSKPIQAPKPVGVVPRILQVIADGFNFLRRKPLEALLMGSMWLLLAGPVWLAWRRRSITGLEGAPV